MGGHWAMPTLFAQVYRRTECEETKSTGSMTFVLRTQLWVIEALLPGDETLMLFPPSIEKIRYVLSGAIACARAYRRDAAKG